MATSLSVSPRGSGVACISLIEIAFPLVRLVRQKRLHHPRWSPTAMLQLPSKKASQMVTRSRREGAQVSLLSLGLNGLKSTVKCFGKGWPLK